MKTKRSRRDARSGFTLIEILVVILILGLLLGVVGTNVFDALIRGKKGTTEIQIRNFEGAIDQFRLNNNGRLPESLDQLTEPDQLTGEALLDRLPMDPWEREYFYDPLDGGNYIVGSYGADGEPGGEGEDKDITNETLDQEE